MNWYDYEVLLKKEIKKVKRLENNLKVSKEHKEWLEDKYNKTLAIAEAVHMEDLHKAGEIKRNTFDNPSS